MGSQLLVNNQETKSDVNLLVGGRSVETDSTFPVINPRTGKTIWKCSSASTTDCAKAVEAAQAAFPSWSRTRPAFRRDIFLRAANLIEERKDLLESYMEEETGAVKAFLDLNISTTASHLRDTAGRISGIQGSFPVAEEEGRSTLILKEPYGVVLGIAPWNAPYILGCRAISHALAAGNTTILKGSELSPKCFRALGDIFMEAGLPAGCLNVLFVKPQDAAEVTHALIADPAIGKINFTGSTAVGSKIAAFAGEHLKPVLLELGGKATAMVLKDADLEKAAFGCTLGSFTHSGQVCMATERILVHSSIVTAFTKALKNNIDIMYPPSASALTLISAGSVERVTNLVSDAIEKGASILHGNRDKLSLERSSSLRPIVLTNVQRTMNLHYTESFGPVVSLYTFETEEEALALANDTEYGLAGAVFTESLAAGLRIAKGYITGAVHINGMSIHDEASTPHGGVKKSGFGRFNGNYGLDEFLRTKVVTWED